jgi:hypothetical protein
MDEKDFKRIEQLFAKQSEEFQCHIGTLSEDFQHKLDLVVEGQQMLAEKLEATRVEFKEEIRKVDQRVTGIAADLTAHRKDTEAHRGYRVSE